MFIHIYFVILLKDQELDDCISNKLHVFHSSFNDNLSEKNSQSFSIDAYATMNKAVDKEIIKNPDKKVGQDSFKEVNDNSIKRKNQSLTPLPQSPKRLKPCTKKDKEQPKYF
ncbi:uncharacterized protein LOC116416246 isoform X2 [Nasonia vitripennis]|uniref:Uncharacterized protein n=1 Tax=Nasonia vitripennis TaxID=7425 RepID=A0A7M7Q2X2_NASVI|nr:uncharacterized protein LOC116416246 isoform X2 [Nasonia vitripennis]